MNIQEAFNKMVAGLAAQNWVQAISETGTCVYKAPNGFKCAVGHLLPDVPNFSWNSFPTISTACISESMIDKKEQMATAMGVDLDDAEIQDFLMEAQASHDALIGDMKTRFIGIADKYSLEFPKEYL